jgi:phosphate ABC transporter phosphate-binding protein
MIGSTCPACGCEIEGAPASPDAVCPRCGTRGLIDRSSAAGKGETRFLGPTWVSSPTDSGETPAPSTTSGTEGTAETLLRPGASPATLGGAERFDFLGPPLPGGGLGSLAHYRVIRLLGSGGMGLVFLAEDTLLNRQVALKIVRPELAHDRELRLRFQREARATAAVKSDYIVTIYQVGEDRNILYLAMELLEGESLDDALARGQRPDIATVIRIGREAALGLAAAHEKGLVHRDIKPPNLFLEAGTGRVKILDFGLARPPRVSSELTQPGLIVGTPDYMAPEQAEGEEVSEKSDLFSLGAVLYRALSGAKPFGDGSTMAVLRNVVLSEPRPLYQVAPSVPPALVGLVAQLMAKAPADRPASARAVAEALEVFARDPASLFAVSAPIKRASPPPAPVRRRHLLLGAAVAAAAVVLAVAAFGALALFRNFGTGPVAVTSERGESRPESAPPSRSSPRMTAKGPDHTVPPPVGHTLNGAGSTLIAPLIDEWATGYRTKGIGVKYLPVGSGKGIHQLIGQDVDFACSEMPLTEEELKRAEEAGGAVMYIPVALGGIVPAYNLEGLREPLRFSGPVLAGIYLGDIKKWNNPALAKINPGVDLPDMDILVIHRGDESGSTYIFTDFLSKVSKDWRDKMGTAASLKWPVGMPARKNEGMVAELRSKPGSIAYVDLLYALQNKVKFGDVKNQAGLYVHANLDTVVAAADGMKEDIPADLRFSLTYAPGKEAYPICGCTWVIIYARQPEGRGQRLVEFLRWVTNEGQEYNTDLFYAKVPQSLAERVKQRLQEVKIEK